jgi:uroporphyrinogen-III synthase
VTTLRLLITRPQPDASRTADALRAVGHTVLLAPMLTFETIRDAMIGAGPWAGLLLTSANAARALAQHARFAALKDLPALAVGDRTAEVSGALGFADVTSTAGNAADLARAATARFAAEEAAVLYAAAEDRAVDVADLLAGEGVRVNIAVLYRMTKAVEFPPDVAAALGGGQVDGVLHYSRRAAEAYLACTGHLRAAALAPTHYCLSAEVAKPLIAAGTDRIRIALRPDEGALFELLTLD